MKKLLPVIAPSIIALAIGAGIAYAQVGSTKSNSALTTEIGSNLPDNTTGLITPFTLRQTVLDMLNSTPIACVTEPTPTTYTLLTSDYGCLVTFNSNSAITAKLSTPSVIFPFVASINNLGTGSITISPVTGTINNAATLNVGTSGIIVFSDGSNYKGIQVSGSGGGGGSTTPGGSNTQVQYNNASAFGGISGVTSDGASISATTATIGTLTGTVLKYTTATVSGNLTATTAQITGWLTGTGANFQTGSFAGNLTATTAQITGWLTNAGANFQTASIAGNLTSAQAQITGWLTAPGANFQTGSFAGNITGSTGAQFLGQVTGTSAVFQTVTINNLTPGGPNCLQETGGLVQATNSTCGASVSGGAAGAVALWNSATVLTNDIGITFLSTGQLTLNPGTFVTATTKALNITGAFNSSSLAYDAPLFMSITNTASNAGSLLVDIGTVGGQAFKIRVDGTVFVGHSLVLGNANNIFDFGTNTTISGGVNVAGVANSWTVGNPWRVSGGTRATSAISLASSDDVLLIGEATGTMALRNAANAQTIRVYNTADSGLGVPTNFERGIVDFQTTTNAFVIGTQAAGTGVGRTMNFVASNTIAMSISPTINLYGQTNPGANETYAVCAGSGATSLTSGGQVFVDTTACLASTMMVKHNIAAFNDYGMRKLASLAMPLHAEDRLATAPIDIDPIAEAMALVPVVATYDTIDSDNPQFTLIAQNACAVDERLCERTRDGSVRAFRPNAVISILIAAFQKQQAEIEELKRRLH